MQDSSIAAKHLELAENLLGGSLTLFGRLTTVAALRDSHTGRYEHALLRRVLDADAAQNVLYRLHRKCFVEWLGLTLAQQRGDLSRYFNSTASENSNSVVLWLDHRLYQSLVPADAPSYEVELFSHDIWLALQSIQYDFDPQKTHFELDIEAPPVEKPPAKERRLSGLLLGWKKRQWSPS